MNDTMTMTVEEILRSKKAAGPDAFLWLHAGGDCVLWPNEDSSAGDPGVNAIGRWQLSDTEAAALIDSGEVDEIC